MNKNLKEAIDAIHDAYDDFMCSIAGTNEDMEAVENLIEALKNYKDVTKIQMYKNLVKQYIK